MKTLKILSFLLIGTIGVQTAFADDGGIKFGIRAGLNMAKIERSGNSSEEGEYSSGGTSGSGMSQKGSYTTTSDASDMSGNLIGFHIGAVADIKITDFLYVQPGLLLSSKGMETESIEDDEYTYSGNSQKSKYKYNVRMNPYYIDVPIMVSLKGTLADNLALRAQAGPYLGFGLFGGAEASHKEERYRNGEPDPDNFDPENGAKRKVGNVFSPTDEEKEEFEFGGLSRFNCGLSFGIGIEYSNFYLGVSYNYGLTSLESKYDYNHTDTDEIMPGYEITNTEKGTRENNSYERTLSITLGYNF
ncbi:MAG: PorT family protein [Fibromonadales bacterium]|nr:PorT family protein [Fibromonadales bacterium]